MLLWAEAHTAFSLVTKGELPHGPSWDPTFLSPGAAQPISGVHLQVPMRTQLSLPETFPSSPRAVIGVSGMGARNWGPISCPGHLPGSRAACQRVLPRVLGKAQIWAMCEGLLMLNPFPHSRSLERDATPHWPHLTLWTLVRVAVSVSSHKKPGSWGQALPRPPAWHECAHRPSLGPGEAR